MSKYRKYYGYYYLPSDEQNLEQENKTKAEIENEQENKAINKTGQNDHNASKIMQSVTNLNVAAAGSIGQNAVITAGNGADTNGTSQGQANTQNPINVPILIPVNNADQAGRDLKD